MLRLLLENFKLCYKVRPGHGAKVLKEEVCGNVLFDNKGRLV